METDVVRAPLPPTATDRAPPGATREEADVTREEADVTREEADATVLETDATRAVATATESEDRPRASDAVIVEGAPPMGAPFNLSAELVQVARAMRGAVCKVLPRGDYDVNDVVQDAVLKLLEDTVPLEGSMSR